MNNLTLLQEIADLENLESAFHLCLAGKRSKYSPQLAFLQLDAYLERLHHMILSGQNYPWGPYKEFYISDPKRRLVSSAPFIDRVTHRAIYNVISPLLDGRLIENSFACRDGKGNGRAVKKLVHLLRETPDYYVVKIDVKKFFASIHHGRLLGKLCAYLPDDSCAGLFKGLLRSHPDFRHGVGLPLGNLTSQIFANFYMHNLDDLISDRLDQRYIRYMDDLVLVCRSKAQAQKIIAEVMALAKIEKLTFPSKKRVWIGNGKVPFLGFLVGPEETLPLNRNRRRVGRKIREKYKRGFSPSKIAQSLLSYRAWMSFPKRG
ncbi:MAG: hypothetical protein BroJett040_08290 [Oligoflexia bacterium]|nr:MAG: hypothetical protein BroJett040_08290 [Oligoflexia bacterium]